MLSPNFPPSFPPNIQGRRFREGRLLILRLIDQLVLADPRHHGAQLLAHPFDFVAGGAAAHGLEAGLAGAAFRHPLAGETARLNVVEDLLHAAPDGSVDEPRTRAVIAIFGGVGNRIAHVGDTALVD